MPKTTARLKTFTVFCSNFSRVSGKAQWNATINRPETFAQTKAILSLIGHTYLKATLSWISIIRDWFCIVGWQNSYPARILEFRCN
jgi:hypothetical protein